MLLQQRKIPCHHPFLLGKLAFISGVWVCAKSLWSCLTLRPQDYSLQDSSVHGILQARVLEWIAMPSPRGSSPPRDRTHISYISCIGRQVLYHQHHLGSPFISGAQRQKSDDSKNFLRGEEIFPASAGLFEFVLEKLGELDEGSLSLLQGTT